MSKNIDFSIMSCKYLRRDKDLPGCAIRLCWTKMLEHIFFDNVVKCCLLKYVKFISSHFQPFTVDRNTDLVSRLSTFRMLGLQSAEIFINL